LDVLRNDARSVGSVAAERVLPTRNVIHDHGHRRISDVRGDERTEAFLHVSSAIAASTHLAASVHGEIMSAGGNISGVKVAYPAATVSTISYTLRNPPVSHSCNRTVRSSRYMVLDRKSMPECEQGLELVIGGAIGSTGPSAVAAGASHKHAPSSSLSTYR
jgi:hypothetical protein